MTTAARGRRAARYRVWVAIALLGWATAITGAELIGNAITGPDVVRLERVDTL